MHKKRNKIEAYTIYFEKTILGISGVGTLWTEYASKAAELRTPNNARIMRQRIRKKWRNQISISAKRIKKIDKNRAKKFLKENKEDLGNSEIIICR